MAGALDGIRVVDLTTIFSGPICTSILGDQGADVIKVESPAGDWIRTSPGAQRNGVVGSFAMMNRNKRSIVVDLTLDEGREIVKRLIDGADVVVENYRPGVMERMGLGYESLKETNPALIYASINGVGKTGPYANRRMYDAIVQAISGFASLQSDPHTERPVMINSLICDKLTALVAAQAITAAIVARESSGVGQEVDVAMLDAALFVLWPDNMVNDTFVGDGAPKVPLGSHEHFVRKTKDGYICIMPIQEAEWLGLFRALEMPNLLEDPAFRTDAGFDLLGLYNALDEAIACFDTDEALTRLEAEEVPVAKINARDEVVNDPQVQAMESLWEYDHTFAGRLRQARPPARFSATPSEIFRCSPELGEHTTEILQELGMDPAAVKDVLQRKVVR